MNKKIEFAGKEVQVFTTVPYPNMSGKEFLSMMIAYRDAMYDNMEGTDADDFDKFQTLFCAAATIVEYGLKEMGCMFSSCTNGNYRGEVMNKKNESFRSQLAEAAKVGVTIGVSDAPLSPQNPFPGNRPTQKIGFWGKEDK